MSKQATGIEVVFDCVIKGFDKRLEGPTVALVGRVLDEAGFDGLWTLRDSRRIRKKGRGRFAAIRIESRAGAKSVRVWCKPKGNDSCFEYSLYPPADVEAESAFRVLSRVHAVTLEVAKSALLPSAVLGRIMDVPNSLAPPPEACEATEVENEACVLESIDEEGDSAEEERESATTAAEESESESKTDVAGAGDLDRGQDLTIEPNSDLWDREVADRALMAIAFVAEDGFARKAEASSSMIRHLGIEQFASGGSECYRTVQGSMRALTMALWKKWRYIDRVRYSSDDGRGASDAIKGYKITPKGHKRLDAIGGSFGPRASALLGDRTPVVIQRAEIDRPAEGITAATVGAAASIDIETIKGMVQRHEEAKKQIEEHDEVIASMDAEIRSLGIELEGLSSVEADRRRKLAEMQLEIDEIARKKSEVSKRLGKKTDERRQWSEMRDPHLDELRRIESILVGRAK